MRKIAVSCLVFILIALISGSCSAIFLMVLEWLTNLRSTIAHWYLGLPLAGLIIGYTYEVLQNQAARGTNEILENLKQSQHIISWVMAPTVLVSTWLTHLVGGSAGREGTAVQMNTALADQFSRIKKHHFFSRKLLLRMGIAGGFASVFGTPLAGAFFAIEISKLNKGTLLQFPLIVLSAFAADFVCHLSPAVHTVYPSLPAFSFDKTIFFWITLSGILFGLAALSFSALSHVIGIYASKLVPRLMYRTALGGTVLAIFFSTGLYNDFAGLGIPSIQSAFENHALAYVFALKIAFTAFTLGVGFKGGEVTPLFFIGATLGSYLSVHMPLDIAFLAALGFVAVFAGATHTPLASFIMGCELFGFENAAWLLWVCLIAFLSSGTKGIYTSQDIRTIKKVLYQKTKVWIKQ